MMKMKNFKQLIFVCIIALGVGLIFNSCLDEDQEFGAIIVPSNLTLSFQIVGQDADNPNGDGSGLVNFTASADDAITYRYAWGDGTENDVAPSGNITHRFNLTGVNTYNVTVIASGTGGVTTSTSVTIDVFSAFDDQEAKDLLSGGAGSSKTWYLEASEPGHLGVGPSLALDLVIFGTPTQFYFPSFFSAVPFEKCGDPDSDCLCDDELTFSLDANGQLTYELNNNGQTYFNAGHQAIVGGDGAGDLCFDFDTSGVSNVSLAPSNIDWSLIPDASFLTPRGTVLNFSDDAFMGYYVSSSSYEIMEVTDSFLYVRTIDGNDPNLAWYHKFTTTAPNSEILVWEDNFDVDGAPDPANWTYDIGTGTNGWGNNEEQYYTDAATNVIVEDGLLKITARAESFMGSNYTSARLKSEDLFEFQYGRVEIRAKLPDGGGTWPALWMLGANHPEVSWPASGEMDIMEHVGNNPNVILGTVHWDGGGFPASFGETTTISNATSEFHVYSMEWDEDSILISVDDDTYFSFGFDDTFPFAQQEFFFLLNIAMGGDLGGAIDPGFTESTMEIDYIRVYQ
ncbi:MAG: family 16 glycosylhydrolase [Flavobacteriaceae bacterium]|nr:family 16 glycosylhydrolase [Flavobacteriaceae bacterium]